MRTKVMLNTSLKASVICLGTGWIGSKINRQDSFALLDAYFEKGGNFIDTAKVYNDWRPGEKSVSEKTIGLWMRERKNRHQVVIATKGGFPEIATLHIPRLTPQDLIADITMSLQSLNVECIDLYWLHRDDVKQPVEGIIDTLAEQVKLGKIKYFGCSNWSLERIQAAQEYAKKKGCVGFSANQPMWSLAEVNIDSLTDKLVVVMNKATKEYHQKNNFVAVPYSSQASGWFQKKDQNKLTENLRKTYDNPISEERFRRVNSLAKETGFSISQIVLAYMTSHPIQTFPIIGCQNLEHLEDSLSASDVQLTPEQVKFLEA